MELLCTYLAANTHILSRQVQPRFHGLNQEWVNVSLTIYGLVQKKLTLSQKKCPHLIKQIFLTRKDLRINSMKQPHQLHECWKFQADWWNETKVMPIYWPQKGHILLLLAKFGNINISYQVYIMKMLNHRLTKHENFK